MDLQTLHSMWKYQADQEQAKMAVAGFSSNTVTKEQMRLLTLQWVAEILLAVEQEKDPGLVFQMIVGTS